MATYNGSRYIKEQIESILQQLPVDAELIISDDSSTDETVDIIKGFDDHRIVFLPGQQFKKPIFNFENAIKHATGDVILLADQDDIWLPGKIELVSEHIKEHGTGITLLMMDGNLVDENSNQIAGGMFSRRNAGPGIIHNLKKNSYMGCNLAFTRALLAKALPFPKKIPMHDSWLGLLAEVYGTVEFIDTKTMNYRLHENNSSIFESTVWQKITWRWRLLYNLIIRIIVNWFRK